MRPLNVLLFLSQDQKPEPQEEISRLEAMAKQNPAGGVAFATTREVHRHLTPGKSRIAFFADTGAGHAHELLGGGVYQAYIPRYDEDGQEQTAWKQALEHAGPLYGRAALPETCVGFLMLTDLQVRLGDVEMLDGIMEGGHRLTTEALSALDTPGEYFGTRKSAVFYLEGTGTAPTPEETIELLRAKRHEVDAKVQFYARRWQEQQQNARAARERERQLLQDAATQDDGDPQPASDLDIRDRMKQLLNGQRPSHPIFKALIEERFSQLAFKSESLDRLWSAAADDAVWKCLGELDDGKPVTCDWMKFRGTDHWFRAKMSRWRILWRRPPARHGGRLWVLVDLKDNQGRYIGFVKAHDQH